MTVRSTVKTIVNNSLGVKDKNRLVHAFKSIYTGGFMRISKRAINSTITWEGRRKGVRTRTIYEAMNRLVNNNNHVA